VNLQLTFEDTVPWNPTRARALDIKVRSSGEKKGRRQLEQRDLRNDNMTQKTTTQQRIIRHRRVRGKVTGTSECPRICVFRSQKHLYAQLVDDTVGKVIASVSDLKLKRTSTRVELAKSMGELLAKAAKDKGIVKVVFDRGGYKYHGSVKALAEGAREGGLQF